MGKEVARKYARKPKRRSRRKGGSIWSLFKLGGRRKKLFGIF